MKLKLFRLSIAMLAIFPFSHPARAQSNGLAVFLSQPQSVVVAVGSNTTFAVTATGTAPLAFQWQFNGTNLIGNPNLPPYQITTRSNLIITKATITNAGPYEVVVSNSWGSVTSSVAILTLAYPPVITSQPASLTVSNGNPVTFTVGATGTGPLAYQWLFTPFAQSPDGQNPKGTEVVPNIITLAAGNGTGIGSYSGDGGAATNAGLSSPTGLALDAAGDLFIADRVNNRIREADTSGIISTVAGNGGSGYNGSGNLAANTTLFQPSGVALDRDDNIFIADSLNQRLRELTFGFVINVAGTGVLGYSGDGGVAYEAEMYDLASVVVDGYGYIYVADTGNSRIRKIDVNDTITTVAGNGTNSFSGDGAAATNAGLRYPGGIALDAYGNLYIADTDNNRIRRVDTNGIITTVAGTTFASFNGDGGAATNTSLNGPSAVAVDSYGQIFIADTENNRIRKVGLNDLMTTVAGNYERGLSALGGPATNTSLASPAGVAVDDFGNIYLADTENQRVCKVTPQGPSFTVPGVNATNGGFYQVIVSSPWGSVTSSVASLSVDLPPVIIQQPNNQTRLIGSDDGFIVAAVTGVANLDGPGLYYQWQFNGTNLPAAASPHNPELLFDPVGSANAGPYDVVITNAYGSVTSRVVTLTVAYPPAITSQPAGQSVVNGGTASFNIGVTGTPPFFFQWQRDGANLANGGEISGVSTTNLVLTPVSTNADGLYDVVITSSWGSVTSIPAPLQVVFPPVIANQPASQSILSGQDAAFSVGVTGTAPLSYQWLFEGVALSNSTPPGNFIMTVAGDGQEGYSGNNGPATNATMSIPYGIAVDNNGTLYIADSQDNYVRKVANGIITSIAGNGTRGYTGDNGPATNASIGVVSVAVDNLGNVFLADQQNSVIRRIDANGIITTIAGTGTAGYTGDGGPATNATLNFSSGVSLDGQGNLYVADQHNSVIRRVATNGIISTVAGNGAAGYAGDGGAATNASLRNPFGVLADTAGNFYIADNNNNVIRKVDTNGIITTVAGDGTAGYAGDGGAATNSRLNSPTGVVVDAAGNLFIADSANQVIRQVAANGIITTFAGNGGTGYSGDGGAATNATLDAPSCLAVDAAGNVYISDTYNDAIRKVTRQVAGGSSGPTLTLNDVTTTNAGSYQVVVTNAWGTATSIMATLTILYPPGITNQPVSLEIVNGGTAMFNVTATGTAPLSYQWQFNGTDLTNGGIVSGSDTANLVLTGVAALDAGGYDVIVSNAYGSVTSSVAVLTIAYPPAITQTPANALAPVGGSAHFIVIADGTGPATYQWRFDGANVSDGGVYSGSTTTNLLLTQIATNNAGAYDVIVSNSWGSVTSSVATLTIAYPPTITIPPVSVLSTNANQNAQFTVVALGAAPLFYQWQFNGTNLPSSGNPRGGNTAILVFDPVRATNVGQYDVIVSNAWGGVTSSIVTLNIPYAPVITRQPLNVVLTNLYTAAFSVGATGTGPFTYQWLLNGKIITNNIITTVAGTNVAGYSGDGGSATNARLNFPAGVTLDSAGNLFIADTENERIRKVNAQGIISTVAGTGGAGYNGNGLLATNSLLNMFAQYPITGLAVDAGNNLFIADTTNQRIRVDTYDTLVDVAGNGSRGFSGDGGAAYDAEFQYPTGLAVDSSGNVYFADTLNDRIRKVDVSDIITTVAGNGTNRYSGDGGAATNASLYYPGGVAVDALGNLFIADTDNNRIRKVDTNGIITTVAGSSSGGYGGDGGVATNAYLNEPSGVTVDTNGNLYIADENNNRIRKVTPGGIITTVAGRNTGSYSGDGGAATNANIYNPGSVAVDAAGDLFIADTRNSRVRKVTVVGPVLTLANLTTNNGGTYQVIVSGPYGSATSTVATLTLDLSPTISLEPAGEIVFAGGFASFFVSDSGTPPLHYQWQFDGTNVGGSDAASSEFSFYNVAPGNAGAYQLIITNAYGSVTSSVATLTVALPEISAATATNDTVTITLTTAPNVSSRLFAATNLVPPVVWLPVYTNVSGANGRWQFSDTNTTAYPARFYLISTP